MGWLGDKIADLFDSLWTFIKDVFFTVLSFFADIIAACWLFLKTAAELTWDFVKDIVNELWGWVSDLVADIWTAILEYIDSAYITAKDWIIEWMGGFADWLDTQATNLGLEISIDDLSSSYATLANTYADAAWLLPLNGVAGIIASTFVAVALIRAIRWLISFLWITG